MAIESKKKEPPGCPPGPPPTLTDFIELDSDYEYDEPPPVKTKRTKSVRLPTVVTAAATPSTNKESEPQSVSILAATAAAEVEVVLKPTSLQQRMLAISGQNIDEFMKEMEHVQKKKELERAADLNDRLATLEKDNVDSTSPPPPLRPTLSRRSTDDCTF